MLLKKAVYDEVVQKVNAIKAVDTSDLIQKAECNRKIAQIRNKISGHDKCINSNNFNKFTGAIFDKRSKQVKSAINNDLNTAEQSSIKNEEKMKELETFELSHSLRKKMFSDDCF